LAKTVGCNCEKMKKKIVYIFFILSNIIHSQDFNKMLKKLESDNQKCLDLGKNMYQCSNKYLIQTDSILNLVYHSIKQQLNENQKNSLKQEQIEWIKKKKQYYKDINHLDTGLDNGLDDLMIKNQKKSDYNNERIYEILKYLSKEKVIDSVQNITNFIPKGYKLFEKYFGNLNNDNLEDCILIIKKTDSLNVIKDKYQGKIDRNRRGIIVLLNNDKKFYRESIKNLDCFSSENEDGGVYFSPELSIKIINKKIIIHYSHGRYGYWKYQFRINENEFELIGYDSSYGGAVIKSQTSINFLSKKKLYQKNINENDEGGDEIFENTWSKVNISNLIKLSEIKDFDNLNMSKY
ncbi:lysozyme inhibitor LprI family protein, partial [Wenyingzhuangia sp. 1_MG-2023]|nr:lysozyme inhibitor LprI family protein [Wenyingzhuangia sp. 1_MG-2023]